MLRRLGSPLGFAFVCALAAWVCGFWNTWTESILPAVGVGYLLAVAGPVDEGDPAWLGIVKSLSREGES
jgi:hypothetical protein